MLRISEAVKKITTAINSLYPEKGDLIEIIENVIKDLAVLESKMQMSPKKRIAREAAEESEEEEKERKGEKEEDKEYEEEEEGQEGEGEPVVACKKEIAE